MLRRHLLAMLPLAPALPTLVAEAAARPLSLASLVVDRPAMQRLGRAYLATATERCPKAIDNALRMRLDSMGHDGTAEALARAIGKAISDDFAASRTVLVDGWLLAETECRLCAITVLTA